MAQASFLLALLCCCCLTFAVDASGSRSWNQKQQQQQHYRDMLLDLMDPSELLIDNNDNDDYEGKTLTEIEVPAQLLDKRAGDMGRVFCGQQLVNVIVAVCRGVRNLEPHKRSSSSSSLVLPSLEDQQGSYGRFDTVAQLKYLTPSKRAGAATDCCLKPCTMRHLASFCTR